MDMPVLAVVYSYSIYLICFCELPHEQNQQFAAGIICNAHVHNVTFELKINY